MRERLIITSAVIAAIALFAIGAYVVLVSRDVPALPPQSASPQPAAVLVGAGDIARCDADADEATADLIDEVVAEHPDAVVFTTGDNAYPQATYDTIMSCYDPSWGRHRQRTRPAVGNHDFGEPQGGGHHRYWGDAGGPFDLYYYSFDVGGWHVVVLNSECHRVGCDLDDEDGEQAEWLVADLEANTAECTLAIWHNPRWSSGRYESDPAYQAFWEILHEHGTELVLNGHEHFYERYAPLGPDGEPDPEHGIRQFTIGTGGGELREVEDVEAHSEVQAVTYGVLRLDLFSDGYSWEFLAAEDDFTDAGSGSCH